MALFVVEAASSPQRARGVGLSAVCADVTEFLAVRALRWSSLGSVVLDLEDDMSLVSLNVSLSFSLQVIVTRNNGTS